MLPLYRFIVRTIGQRLGCRTELIVGKSYEPLVTEADVAFVCGLPYVELGRRDCPPLEPLAAPVLQGERYRGLPIYFSDVIVRRDSSFRRFGDLRGCSWCYNEPRSQSGYGIIRYHLSRMGETRGFFGKVVESGFHEKSIHLVCAGEVDASAIDSHVLQIALRDHPELTSRIRVIKSLGPSTIQPIVASRLLPSSLRADLRSILVELSDDPAARRQLARGFVERFVPVDDSSYDDIRDMLDATASAGILTLS